MIEERSVIEQRGIKLRRSWRQRFFLLFNCVVIATAVIAAWALQGAQARTEELTRVALPGSLRPIEDQAESGDRVLNFLLVGSDSSAGLDPNDPIQVGRQGERQSDVMIIAHVDEPNQSVTLFSIPRDLWVPISGTGRVDRINSAYAFGGDGVLIDTIKENMDVEIDYYINIDFAGFQDLVSVVGGVDVYFPEPARDWDSRYGVSHTGFEVLTKGCHYLEPEQALAYVRSRYYQVVDVEGNWVDVGLGDISRIERQQDFLQRFIGEAIAQGARNPFKMKDLVDETLDAVTVDDRLTAQLLIDLATSLRSFDADDLVTYAYPTEFEMIERKSVLLGLDDEAEPMLELLRGVPPTSTATVFVEMRFDPSRQELANDAAELLTNDGYLMGAVRSGNPVDGVRLVYGDDGLQAAELVKSSLVSDGLIEEDITLVYSGDVSGRTVVVTLGAIPSDPVASGGLDETDKNGESDEGPTTSEITESPQVTTDTTAAEPGTVVPIPQSC